MKNQKRKCKPFSLMELVIVIGIMALLSAVALPNFMEFLAQGQCTAAKTQIDSMKQAVMMFSTRNGKLPNTLAELAVANSKGGPYMDREVTEDPWGNPYQFVKPGPNGQQFDIISYGMDGAPGGEGNNADISAYSVNK